MTIPIIFYLDNQTEFTISVPAGSAEYWAKRVMSLYPLEVAGADWPADEPNLPYLGYIRLPSDQLALEHVIDMRRR